MAPRSYLIAALCILISVSILGYRWYYTHQLTSSSNASDVKLNHTIRHLGIIMDGNRRWAKKQGLAAWLGHKKGTDPVKTVVEFCIKQEIPHLSLYAFSLENLKRSEEELNHLFEIVEEGLTNEEFEKLIKHGVKVHILGDATLFPTRLVPIFDSIQEKTKTGTTLTLNILFCYGGQQELTHVMKHLGAKIERGEIKAQDITPELIQQHLWTHDSPNPDLIIRTGGCCRLSNFLPWQSAYSELMFTDTYWPDITADDLVTAVEKFSTVKRNFGA